MHIYAHDINLDNVPQSDVKKLRYVSFLNMTLPELEVLALFANAQPIPIPLAIVAQGLKGDINRIVTESIKVLSENAAAPTQITE